MMSRQTFMSLDLSTKRMIEATSDFRASEETGAWMREISSMLLIKRGVVSVGLLSGGIFVCSRHAFICSRHAFVKSFMRLVAKSFKADGFLRTRKRRTFRTNGRWAAERGSSRPSLINVLTNETNSWTFGGGSSKEVVGMEVMILSMTVMAISWITASCRLRGFSSHLRKFFRFAMIQSEGLSSIETASKRSAFVICGSVSGVCSL